MTGRPYPKEFGTLLISKRRNHTAGQVSAIPNSKSPPLMRGQKAQAVRSTPAPTFRIPNSHCAVFRVHAML
jgi:hypothetical protein